MPVIRNSQYYFREGFCWSEIKTFYIRCRLKQKTINSNKSMSFYQTTNGIPDYFFICLLNSHLVATYVNYFINNTQTFGIDDARQIPIILPSKELLRDFKKIFDDAITAKKKQLANKISVEKAEKELSVLQEKLDNIVAELYQMV